MQSMLHDAPSRGVRQRIRPIESLSWGARLMRLLFWVLATGSFCSMGVLLMITLFPLACFFTVPGLCVAAIVLAVSIPQIVYVHFADPMDAKRPLPVPSLKQCLQIDVTIWRLLRESIRVGRRIAREVLLRRVQRSVNHRVVRNIAFGSNNLSLDVYIPMESATTGSSAPVILFLAPQIRPFDTRKLVFSSLGATLAESIGCVVVIPDLTNYPNGRIRQQVEDIRAAIHWTKGNIHLHGGDSSRLNLAGLGLGGLLALLVPLQSAVVKSRSLIIRDRKMSIELPAGVEEVKEYGSDYPLPRIDGLILIDAITNVDEQLTEETSRGIQHLSLTRRLLGPSERTCYFHSPAHLLYAARNILQLQLLPQKVLFIHGGLDRYTKHTQSETMKEIMRGVGIQDAKVKVYPTDLWDTALGMMCDTQGSPVIDEIYSFLWDEDLLTPRAREAAL